MEIRTGLAIGAIILTVINLIYTYLIIKKCPGPGGMKKAYMWAGSAIFAVLVVLVLIVMLDYNLITMDQFHIWLTILLAIAAVAMAFALSKMHNMFEMMPKSIAETICKHFVLKK